MSIILIDTLEQKKIRSDIQQRLNFIAFLAIRGIDISKYVNSCLSVIKYRVEKLKELPVYDASETVRWLHEVMFLSRREK